ncbi:hypothetical protein FB45DRAFT_1000554 [Roridomyces roridus]|uniref:Uncharacterized protein n=1 Tax=Roridomyces roridus TaxID=1738132 RepID=A0AAD7FXD8_9AGAR|nr:hypothetical protein FB45DRAFT_1000554 [Roridomyces roridus]
MLPPDIPIYPKYLSYGGSATCNPAETTDLVDAQPPSIDSYTLSDDDDASEWEAANADNAVAFPHPASVPPTTFDQYSPEVDYHSADESDADADSDYVEAKAALPKPKRKGKQKAKTSTRAPARRIAPLPSRASATTTRTTTATAATFQPLLGSSSFNAAYDFESDDDADAEAGSDYYGFESDDDADAEAGSDYYGSDDENADEPPTKRARTQPSAEPVAGPSTLPSFSSSSSSSSSTASMTRRRTTMPKPIKFNGRYLCPFPGCDVGSFKNPSGTNRHQRAKHYASQLTCPAKGCVASFQDGERKDLIRKHLKNTCAGKDRSVWLREMEADRQGPDLKSVVSKRDQTPYECPFPYSSQLQLKEKKSLPTAREENITLWSKNQGRNTKCIPLSRGKRNRKFKRTSSSVSPRRHKVNVEVLEITFPKPDIVQWVISGVVTASSDSKDASRRARPSCEQKLGKYI